MTPLTEEQAQQLQPGDKLVCTHMEEVYMDKLDIGKEYTIERVLNGWVHIKETHNRYRYHCFTLPDFVLNSEQKGVTNMRDEVIDLRGSSIEQRRKLANLLVDLGETLFNLETLIAQDYQAYQFGDGVWFGYGHVTPTIDVQSFINKYTRPTTEYTPASTKLTTRVVIGDTRDRFEKSINSLEDEGYYILPETFLINDKRYTILMQLNKPKESPCLQL